MPAIKLLAAIFPILHTLARMLTMPVWHLLGFIQAIYVSSKGVRTVRLLRTNDSVRESYQLETAGGGTILLLCTECVYEMSYSAWWAPAQIHTSYTVIGTCSAEIPDRLTKLITRGFSIGKLLPATARTAAQKKVAMHAFASLLLTEIMKENDTA